MEQTNSTSTDGATTRGVMDRVRESATSQLSSQKDRATDGLGSLAQAVRQSTQSFRDNQQDTVANYVEKAADQIEQFSTRLRERNVKDLLHDAQHFARRQPAMFIGAAFVLGVVAARFLKSNGNNGQYGSGQDGGGRRNSSSTTKNENLDPSSHFDRAAPITSRYAGRGM
jgi:hypothetical protein